MIFEIGVYRMDIDVERTREFYEHNHWFGCGCAGCRNYEKAVSFLSDKTKAFIGQFGIDPGKPAEMSALHSPDEKNTLYNGFFHICGSLIEGKNPRIQIGPKRFRLKDGYEICVDEDCDVVILESCALLDDSFPRPAIQLDVTLSLPWLLEEPNPYL